ncbi:MAG: hypothetical protein JST00_13725 [Deltaproteobacteria bacterium]|nr:hypothetical protein [Deltaproteobacteria bacterium]
MAAALGLGAITTTSRASADPSVTDRAVAQTAFDEGRSLYDSGRHAEACEKFAISRKLDPKLGTIMNLAICYERVGRLASAYAELGEAQSLARREGRGAVVKDALARAQAIAPRLPRARLRVDPSVAELSIDGTRLDPAAWKEDVPLDPGRHTIRASAPGHASVDIELTAEEGATTSHEVGPLVALPDAVKPTGGSRGPDASVAPAPVESRGAGTTGLFVAGGGVAAVALGAVFGAVAIGKRSDAEQACLDGDCVRGARLDESATTFAWASNIAIGVGAAAVVTGVVWWLVTPRRGDPAGVSRVRGSWGSIVF